MLTIKTTPKLYKPAKAEEIADQMNSADDDWTYLADHDPKGTGYSRVAVYDETNELAGYL